MKGEEAEFDLKEQMMIAEKWAHTHVQALKLVLNEDSSKFKIECKVRGMVGT